jgi:multidrug resistance efflux pump
MELLLISSYAAICIAVFTVLRIPLNRWTVPTTSIGGIVLIFALIQLLNYFHPYSGTSQQYLTTTPITPSVTGQVIEVPLTGEEHSLVAWFHQTSRLRLNDGSAAEVTFDSIPGKVFSGKVQMVIPTLGVDHASTEDIIFDPPAAISQPRIPVMINITDPHYANYVAQVPDGSHAQTAIYGEQFHHLALVRKTLLRMSAWMNYLSLFS